MTQQEINNATKVINEASAQLRIAKDKLDTQERIIKTQEEMIEMLKATIANRDKFIAILEGQLVIQDNAINKSMLKG
jgi:hypothetical protein